MTVYIYILRNLMRYFNESFIRLLDVSPIRMFPMALQATYLIYPSSQSVFGSMFFALIVV